MDPVSIATLIATALSLGSKAIGAGKEKKLQKKSAKEEAKQRQSDLLNLSLNQSAENEAEGIRSSHKLGRRRADALKNTASQVRSSYL